MMSAVDAVVVYFVSTLNNIIPVNMLLNMFFL
jgi:hypothetical protein